MSRLDISAEVERLELEGYRQRFECSEGDGRAQALLQAVCFCHDQQIVAPEWAVEAFARASNAWFRLQVGSLDEAFGAETMTDGRRMQALRRRRARPAINLAIMHAKNSNPPVSINEELFQKIGNDVGLCKTIVQEIYYRKKRKSKGNPAKSSK